MISCEYPCLMVRLSLIILASLFSPQLHAQLPDTIVVNRETPVPEPDTASGTLMLKEIFISGNRKTKEYIIRREIQMKLGELVNLQNFKAQILQARSQVYNTNLFDEVTISAIQLDSSNFKLNVLVKERWYIYPSPQFQLIDRSFAEWVKVYNADLERVTYGAKYTQYNITGRRDVIRLGILTGYARNIQFSYTNPYSNSKLTEGFGFGASFTQNREFAFKTATNNQFLNYRTTGFVRTSYSMNASYFSRKGYFSSFSYGIGLSHVRLTDTGFSNKLSDDYFGVPRANITFPEIGFSYRYSNTNNVNYPLTGRFLSYGISKRGLGLRANKVNMLTANASYSLFRSFGKNWYGIVSGAALVKLPFKQSFYNRRALGFGSLSLRGLDAFVVDGVAAAVASYTVKKKITSFNIKFPIKNRLISKVPFAFFAKTYVDAGYAHSELEHRATLNNKLLYTTGVGVDVITFYDIVIGLDYSKNQLQSAGFFFRVIGSL